MKNPNPNSIFLTATTPEGNGSFSILESTGP